MFDTSTILIQTGVCVKFEIENFLELQCLLLYKVGLLLILSSWSNLSIIKKTNFNNKKNLDIDYLFYQQYTFKTQYFHKNVSGSTYTLEKVL